jgi:hypothetical protein
MIAKIEITSTHAEKLNPYHENLREKSKSKLVSIRGIIFRGFFVKKTLPPLLSLRKIPGHNCKSRFPRFLTDQTSP